MRKTLLTLGIAALALAGCAAPPKPLASDAPTYHFWNRLGPAAQSISQVFDNGTTTYVLPKPNVAVLGIQVQMQNGQFIPASLSLDGPYYTLPGVYPTLRVNLIGRTYAIANPHAASFTTPDDSATLTAPKPAPQERPLGNPKDRENAVTIGTIYQSSPQKMGARSDGDILTLRLDALMRLLPDDWTIYTAGGIDTHRMVAVYLTQTPEQAMRSVCQEMELTCEINPKRKTISMSEPAPVASGQRQQKEDPKP